MVVAEVKHGSLPFWQACHRVTQFTKIFYMLISHLNLTTHNATTEMSRGVGQTDMAQVVVRERGRQWAEMHAAQGEEQIYGDMNK